MSAIAAVVVGAGAAVTTVENWQPRIGWMSPNRIQEKLGALEARFESQIANQQITVGIISDQIRCGKWQVELDELYSQVNGGDHSRRLSDRIGRHRAIMDESKCIRFGDY